MADEVGTNKSSLGMDENIAGLLSYLGLLGLIFFLLEKQSRFVKFHGMQSTLLWVAVIVVYVVLGFIPFLGWIVRMVVWLGYIVVSVMMMIKAYNREMVKLPVIGDIAEKQAGV